jgi:hypothetical protein
MSDAKTTIAHHPSCIASQAWDVAEAYDHCSCPLFWPRRVCTECWLPPKRHSRRCSHYVKTRRRTALEDVL